MALPFNVIHKTEVSHRADEGKVLFFFLKTSTTNSLFLISHFRFFGFRFMTKTLAMKAMCSPYGLSLTLVFLELFLHTHNSLLLKLLY